MRSINKVILIGNLTRDPEMRETPNRQSVTTFGIATNRQWVTKDNDKKNSAEFHECVAWARLAEICANYLKKGHLIYVEGYLKTRSWDTPEGIKKFKTEVVVQDMILLEKRNNETDGEYIPSDEEYDIKEMAPPETSTSETESIEDTTPTQEVLAPEEATSVPKEVTSVPEVPAPEEKPKEEESLIDKDLGL